MRPAMTGVHLLTPPSSTDAMPPVAPMTHGTRINEQESKDSLTRKAGLSDAEIFPVAFEDGQPVTPPESPKSHNLEEVCTPDDAPDIMKSTAELFLHKTVKG